MALINCPECSTKISDKSISCVKCGYPIAPLIAPASSTPNTTEKNPGLAAVLSLVIPGLGQIYNGQIGIGLFMMALTFGLYFVVIGFLVHIALIFDAYNYAQKLNTEMYAINYANSVDKKQEKAYFSLVTSPKKCSYCQTDNASGAAVCCSCRKILPQTWA
jgi:TM2 domain-containing membrane protein YozV